MPQEIKIDGIGISPDVLTAIVSRAVSDVEGIASAVVAAIDAQVGVEVERVDVCIDGLVFPKE